jgi:uncharacterized protein YodC (DUF2158 family)
MSFNVGDTVQLKSGGPDMTVMRIGTAGGEPMVWCAWFEGTKDAYALFPPDALKAALEAAEAPSKPPEALKAPPELRPTEADSVPGRPEAVEEPQDLHPTQAYSAPLAGKDSAPPAEENEKSPEDQVASIQSLIASLLKRS